MDQYPLGRDERAGSDKPALIIADDDIFSASAQRTIEGAGLRLGAKVPLHAARQRLYNQGAASAIWIELRDPLNDEAAAVLDEVNAQVSNSQYAAIVSTTGELIDSVMARIDDPRVEIIVDADDAQRAAALAISLAGLDEGGRVADAASDKSTDRLRQLSEEVNRMPQPWPGSPPALHPLPRPPWSQTRKEPRLWQRKPFVR